MANYYITGHGVIVLNKVTPVINALFKTYRIGPFDESESAACITFISDEHLPDWDEVLAGLKTLADDRHVDMSQNTDNSTNGFLASLARHFNKTDDNPGVSSEVQKLKAYSFTGTPELDILFRLASLFDDGHGIENIQYHEYWFSDKVRAGEFNGMGKFISNELTCEFDTQQVVDLGTCLRTAVCQNKPESAAQELFNEIQGILRGIHNPENRMLIQKSLTDLLQADEKSNCNKKT